MGGIRCFRNYERVLKGKFVFLTRRIVSIYAGYLNWPVLK